MPLARGIDLPGSRIRYRTGYDGWEPLEMLRTGKSLPENRLRVAIVIDEDYEDLCDVYRNAALIGLVQDALSSAGLHIVLEEVHRVYGLVPEEEKCSLREDESYLLVRGDLSVVGSLLLWEFSCFGGPFYEESNFILDAILPEDLFAVFVSSLGDLCAQHNVDFEDCGEAERTSASFLRPRVVRVLKRWFGWFRGIRGSRQ